MNQKAVDTYRNVVLAYYAIIICMIVRLVMVLNS